MSLPATVRRRWGLDGGGKVGFLDIGDAVLLVPSSVDDLRREVLESVTDLDWQLARAGFGDPDLANE